MKYISIKDEIFEIVKECDDMLTVSKGKGYIKTLLKDNNIKYADTIKELCDVFVIIDKSHKERFAVSISKAAQFNEGDWNNEYFNVYGAIWNDKGIAHYVAKINDNGELELI